MDRSAPMRSPRHGPSWPAFYLLAYFSAVGLLVWRLDGHIGQLLFFILMGLATGAGMLLHARLRPARKRLGRQLSLALVGGSLFLGAGVFGRQSFQLEGFFFYVLGGVAGGVVIHYLVAKIVGPLFIGRAWCSWGCWIWMVLDYLPYKRSSGRHAKLGWLRTAHFALSLGLVATLAWGFGYNHGFEWARTAGLWWFLAGSGAYYLIGVILAFALKDNRAFCKIACPVSLLLRATSRLALLRVRGNSTTCTQCKSCDTLCPMHVPVSAFVAQGRPVSDPECTLCQNCVAACPVGGLHLSLCGPKS